ncbi:PREDICTED: lysozyme-like [Wasmannia auropunctata]|uniref:lysozyme-like n=1 Tax=Wasmannia auropunctata TaxID=64793 RepID=UPI0005F06718|nr:PREDICTED: lysozyme-like [Wasmannia auropunctata]
MFAKVSWIAVTIIIVFCVYNSAQILSEVCLGCLCEVSTGCNVTIGCSKWRGVCGPFDITRDYWIDAGRPTLNNEPYSNMNAYDRCANDPYCAANVVQAFMAKFGRDCTGDGVVDCEDYLRIHRLGANGCSGTLNINYENRFKLCLQTFKMFDTT